MKKNIKKNEGARKSPPSTSSFRTLVKIGKNTETITVPNIANFQPLPILVLLFFIYPFIKVMTPTIRQASPDASKEMIVAFR